MKNEAIDNVLATSWNLGDFRKTVIMNGESTLNYLVETKEAKYVFRNAGRHRNYVNFQADLLNHLQSNHFSYETPMIIKTNKGTPFLQTADDIYLLYRYVEGVTLKSSDYSTYAFEIGQCVGSFHRITQEMSGYDHKVRSKDIFDFHYMEDSILNSLSRIESQDEKDAVDDLFIKIFSEGIKPYFSQIASLAVEHYQRTDSIPCHGDLNGGNFIIGTKKLVGLIDFGGVIIAPKVFDVQNCLQNIACSNGEVDSDITERIILGYCKEVSLTQLELEIIPSILIADLLRTLAWIFESRADLNCRIKPSEAIFRLKLLGAVKNGQKFL
jgi:Ser/Thr protein kinase RdoA (MazF antagonist)